MDMKKGTKLKKFHERAQAVYSITPLSKIPPGYRLTELRAKDETASLLHPEKN